MKYSKHDVVSDVVMMYSKHDILDDIIIIYSEHHIIDDVIMIFNAHLYTQQVAYQQNYSLYAVSSEPSQASARGSVFFFLCLLKLTVAVLEHIMDLCLAMIYTG